jgi:NUMOD3 motif
MARTPEEEKQYQARHRRNVAQRGKAQLRKCAHCAADGVDEQAHDWAHVHDTDPDDVMNYIPLCKKCHGRYDRHTPEAIEKIRAASTGRKHTPESIAKMSADRKAAAAARGPMPEEQRAKISASLRGKGDGKSKPGARAPGGEGGQPRPVGNPNLGQTRAAQQRAKTHCEQGHEFTPDNIYWRGPNKDQRQCKTCTRERAAARYEAQREAAASVPKPPSRRGGARPGTGDPELGRRYADRQLSKTHCPAGHEYSESNTYIIKRAGGRTARQCKTCTKAKAKAATARRKAA